MNVTRILRDTPATVSLTTYRDGTATDVGTVTLTATKADGTELFEDQAVTDGGTGTYSYAFTATHTSELNFLTLTWTEAQGESYTTYVEIVGGHLFTEAQARAYDNSAMTNTTKYTDGALAEERDRITDELETRTGVSWVPRFRRVKLAGTGTDEIWLPNTEVHRIISCSIAGTAQTLTDIEIDETVQGARLVHKAQHFTLPTNTSPRNVVVEYAHGYRYVHDGVDRIALMLLRNRAVPSSIDDLASSFTNQDGTFRVNHEPVEVSRWIMAHDQRMPV